MDRTIYRKLKANHFENLYQNWLAFKNVLVSMSEREQFVEYVRIKHKVQLNGGAFSNDNNYQWFY